MLSVFVVLTSASLLSGLDARSSGLSSDVQEEIVLVPLSCRRFLAIGFLIKGVLVVSKTRIVCFCAISTSLPGSGSYLFYSIFGVKPQKQPHSWLVPKESGPSALGGN